MRSFAVVTQVKQTLGAVEVGRFNAFATDTSIAAMCRIDDRLRELAHAHRVAAASVSGRRQRQRRHRCLLYTSDAADE